MACQANASVGSPGGGPPVAPTTRAGPARRGRPVQAGARGLRDRSARRSTIGGGSSTPARARTSTTRRPSSKRTRARPRRRAERAERESRAPYAPPPRPRRVHPLRDHRRNQLEEVVERLRRPASRRRPTRLRRLPRARPVRPQQAARSALMSSGRSPTRPGLGSATVYVLRLCSGATSTGSRGHGEPAWATRTSPDAARAPPAAGGRLGITRRSRCGGATASTGRAGPGHVKGALLFNRAPATFTRRTWR